MRFWRKVLGAEGFGSEQSMARPRLSFHSAFQSFGDWPNKVDGARPASLLQYTR